MYGAVDIGGTKTLVAVFDGDGKVIERVKFSTPQEYDGFVTQLGQVVADLQTKDFQRVAVAMPGLPDRKHGIGIAFGNLPWEHVPLQADTEKIFQCPTLIENDAKLAALSEATLLRDKFNSVLYLTISTGIGGGLIIDGRIDPHFEDMEVGQMLIEHDGLLQNWEDVASGSAIVKKFGQRASDINDPKAWQTITHNLALGIHTLIATLTPEVIVVGGGVGAHFDKFESQLNEQLHRYENPLMRIPPILRAERAEEAVIYGCYELAKGHHGQVTGRA